jgi:hypothetical protein
MAETLEGEKMSGFIPIEDKELIMLEDSLLEYDKENPLFFVITCLPGTLLADKGETHKNAYVLIFVLKEAGDCTVLVTQEEGKFKTVQKNRDEALRTCPYLELLRREVGGNVQEQVGRGSTCNYV